MQGIRINGDRSGLQDKTTQVVCKLEFDAKSRGRSVQIRFHRKVISQKNKTRRRRKKIYYINGGTPGMKNQFCKKNFCMVKSVVVHRKKFIHTQNHFNEQVVIELVFFYTLFIHVKRASYQHKAGGY